MAAEASVSGPLAGMRIIDLADDTASFCSAVMARLGAEVIKIYRPESRDSWPPAAAPGDGGLPRQTLSRVVNDANKTPIFLDLRQERGKTIFLKWVRTSDALVETFPAGYLERIGLDSNILRQANPDLIVASVTGFGQNGPRKNFRAGDLVAAALGGQMFVTGKASAPPLKIFGDQCFCTASLFAAAGILLALRQRRMNGVGSHIEVSLLEAVASTLDHVLVRYFADGTVPQRTGSRHWTNEFAVFPCRDGFIHMTLFYLWETLVELLKRDNAAEDLSDKRWLDERFRARHVDHACEVVSRWTRRFAVADLFELGQTLRLPWAPVRTLREVVECPQLRTRNFWVQVRHPSLGIDLRYPGLPMKFEPIFALIEKPGGLSAANACQTATESPLPPAPCIEVIPARKIRKPISRNAGILEGVRVLDFTRVLAGPYATRLLGDFGAEVIKVQSSKISTGVEDEGSAYFRTWNRNKRSITLNMSHPKAVPLLLQIVEHCDVIVENFAPRVMANWGLDYAVLRKARSDIIMLRMSGFGQTGPWREYVAFAPTVQSLAGLTSLTSYSGTEPIGPGVSPADTIAGLYGAVGILAALEYRERTGRGLFIDLSELESLCTTLGAGLLDVFLRGEAVAPQGNSPLFENAAPYGCYPCSGKDRWCVIEVHTESEWQALCRVMGHPPWAADPSFSTAARRRMNAAELDAKLGSWTLLQTAERIVLDLQQAGVPAGIVQDAGDLVRDPQLAARGFFTTLVRSPAEGVLNERCPIRFYPDRPPVFRPAPRLGQDNDYVFQELLHLSESTYRSLREEGVLT
jgi:crotonobetainyl-CoA:carnitine CoA-transferase CaiB-like acyl-CoA transferase